MANKIEIQFTKPQFNALCSLVNNNGSMLEECIITQKEIKLVDRALNKSGYKRETDR